MAASLRKMPTTSVRRLISPFSRSSGLALCNLLRCWGGKFMEADTVGRGIVHECCELSHLWPELVGDAAPLALACSASSWAKVVAMRAETTRRLLARLTRAWSYSRRWLLASREHHRDNASQMALLASPACRSRTWRHGPTREVVPGHLRCARPTPTRGFLGRLYFLPEGNVG